MDCELTMAIPLAAVFAHVATPSLLGDWLTDVVWVESMPSLPLGIGFHFLVSVQRDGRLHSGTGEVIAYEPPATIAYRITARPHMHVVRLSCAASSADTRLRIHQVSAAPLAVDLSRLEQALARRAMPHGAITDTKWPATCRDPQPTGDNASHKTGERNQP
jgi:uncharacterized protein YndB with AHSA1/START domain